jgi:PAS domain S-box-containing protein
MKSSKQNKSNLVDGKYSIKDLVDLEKLRKIFEKFPLATGNTIGFVSYPEQEILIATGWRDICTKFHRAFPESSKACIKSNVSMTSKLKKIGDIIIEPCDNGLVDGGTPIIIKGKHIATLATGQVFFKKPDIKRFKKQAETYGYDVKQYLKAVEKVPVVTKKEFSSTLSFLGEIAITITELGYANLEAKGKSDKLRKEIREHKKSQEALKERETLFRTLIETTPSVIVCLSPEGRILEFNPEAERIYGRKRSEVLGKNYLKLFLPEDAQKHVADDIKKVISGEPTRGYENAILSADGTEHLFLWNVNRVSNFAGQPEAIIATGIDITEHKRAQQQLAIFKEFAEV